MIWKMPKKTPWPVAVSAVAKGIPHAATASSTERMTATSADFHAAILKTPSMTNRTTSGSAATSADRAREPPTGESG